MKSFISKLSLMGFSTVILFIFLNMNAFGLTNNIFDMGAIPDGKTLVTAIIQKAIDNCSAGGGGNVIVPAGKFLTGTIVLKNNVCLKLEIGAVLLGSTNPKDYIQMKPKYIAYRTGIETRQLIYAEDLDNIGIVGEGTIDGQGSTHKPADMDGAGLTDAGITRPHLIQFIACTNVRIEGIFLTNSAAWMQHYLACDHLTINGIRVSNFCNWNNDGIDIDGCHDVMISDCLIESADDAICLKATSPRSCKDVVITNCNLHTLSSAIKMGTETTGGFKNVTISNCAISPVENNTFDYNSPDGGCGIALMIVDGGTMEQVNINNITISEIVCPVIIRLGNRARPYTPVAPVPPVGKVSNITLSNIMAVSSHKTTSSVTGIPGYDVENVLIDNFTLINKSGGTVADANLVVPENVAGYPGEQMHGSILPASGFYVRHARNIRFSNFRLVVEEDNVRPAFVLDDAKDIDIILPSFSSVKTQVEMIKEVNCKNVRVISE
jgi:polygalacturonase